MHKWTTLLKGPIQRPAGIPVAGVHISVNARARAKRVGEFGGSGKAFIRASKGESKHAELDVSEKVLSGPRNSRFGFGDGATFFWHASCILALGVPFLG